MIPFFIDGRTPTVFSIALLAIACSGEKSNSPETQNGPHPDAPKQDTGEFEQDSGTPNTDDTGDVYQDTGDDTGDVTKSTGAFSGDLEITLYTQFGDDTCEGSAEMDVTNGTTLAGTGSCSFSLLGSQTPGFVGTLSENGTLNGTLDLEIYGSAFNLDWAGTWTETRIEVDYSDSTTLDSIGDIDFDIQFSVEAEETDTDTNPDDPDWTDYGMIGTEAYSKSTGTHTTTDGCEMDYSLFSPASGVVDTLVVIQHGFARSAENFSDWGNHLASWGLPTVIMQLCHASALDVNLDQNGADTVELVEHLWSGPVIYMGHSNGAVSSIVSASIDADAIAVLGLDAVERLGGDHTDDANMLNIPVYALFGEASYCNSWNSGQSAYESASDNAMFRITEADHCDFESPTDSICTSVCGGTNDSFNDDDILSTIKGMSTGFLLWQALGKGDGAEWWSQTGVPHTALEDAGAISTL